MSVMGQRGILLAIILLSWVGFAEACTIPVFRYALDRWPSEPWRLEIPTHAFTTEPLATELRNLGATSPLNLEASVGEGTSKLAFPGDGAVAWQAEKFTETDWNDMTESPARRELARRILAGESAVWVIVSDSLEDPVLALLNKRLSFLEAAIPPPVVDPNDPESQLGPGPELKLKYSTLAIKANDAAERFTIPMLAGPHLVPAPFTALVFGRGRVLGAWPTAELNDEFVEQTILYLVKACTCQAKAQNPGWDLLMQVDWDAALRKVEEARLRATEAPPQSRVEPPITGVIKPHAEPSPSQVGRLPLSPWAAVGVLVLALWLLTYMRAKLGRR